VTYRRNSFIGHRQPRPYQTSASQIQGEAAIQTAQHIDAYLKRRLSERSMDSSGKEPTLAAHMRKSAARFTQ
jgi:hypothetical protein